MDACEGAGVFFTVYFAMTMALALAVGAAFWVRRRRSGSGGSSGPAVAGGPGLGGGRRGALGGKGLARAGGGEEEEEEGERESWQIPFRELKFLRRIGKGNVGEVFEGQWHGNRVAIKRLLGSWYKDADMVERFREEILLMSTMHHPNVLVFVGAVLDAREGHMCLVTELCRNGTVHDYLHRSDVKLSWRLRVAMATDIARGMHYLHGRAGIIQRDLKTANLLLDDFLHVKIADFGLSRTMAPGRMDTYCGTPATMAPEIVRQEVYSEKADVFSFAIILWEILTREDPYPGRTGLALAMDVSRGLRPPVPAYCPAEYAEIMTRAWSQRPEDRPSFDDILEVLQGMQRVLDESIRRRNDLRKPPRAPGAGSTPRSGNAPARPTTTTATTTATKTMAATAEATRAVKRGGSGSSSAGSSEANAAGALVANGSGRSHGSHKDRKRAKKSDRSGGSGSRAGDQNDNATATEDAGSSSRTRERSSDSPHQHHRHHHHHHRSQPSLDSSPLSPRSSHPHHRRTRTRSRHQLLAEATAASTDVVASAGAAVTTAAAETAEAGAAGATSRVVGFSPDTLAQPDDVRVTIAGGR